MQKTRPCAGRDRMRRAATAWFASAIGAVVSATAPASSRAGDGAPAAAWSLDGARSLASYHLTHKFHRVDATSHRLAGLVNLFDDGRAQVQVRAPVESFDSGNVNRDEHMKEVVEAARWPLVEVKAIGAGVVPPAQFPATVRTTLRARVELHGVPQTVDLPVTITFETPTRVHATGSLTASLDAFKIDRPSLMFIQVDDKLRVDLDVIFQKS